MPSDTQVLPPQSEARFLGDAAPRPADDAAPRTVAGRLVGHTESRRVVKYGLVGIVNVTIDFALYALLVSTGVWYVAAKILSLAVATINGYTWNRLWTFRAGRHRHETLVKYISVQGACLVLNLALLSLLVEVLGRDAIGAQLIALPLVAGASFLANRLWTFGSHVGTGRR